MVGVLTGKCELCGKQSSVVSSFLEVCRSCIVDRPENALEITDERHKQSRIRFSLPYTIPSQRIECGLCGNNCKSREGKNDLCGLKRNEKGRLLKSKELLVEVYYDPHPTNCVPMQFCGASGAGYPKYSYTIGRENGYSNLSVFCVGCSYDCSFCQNWHYREMVTKQSWW